MLYSMVWKHGMDISIKNDIPMHHDCIHSALMLSDTLGAAVCGTEMALPLCERHQFG